MLKLKKNENYGLLASPIPKPGRKYPSGKTDKQCGLGAISFDDCHKRL